MNLPRIFALPFLLSLAVLPGRAAGASDGLVILNMGVIDGTGVAAYAGEMRMGRGVTTAVTRLSEINGGGVRPAVADRDLCYRNSGSTSNAGLSRCNWFGQAFEGVFAT